MLPKCKYCSRVVDEYRFIQCLVCRTNNRNAMKRYRTTLRNAGRPMNNPFLAMVRNARFSDKKYGRTTTAGNYITSARLKFLFKLQKNECIYCRSTMQVLNRMAPSGMTIERIFNDLPHTLHNCFLACHSCNCRRKRSMYPIIQRVFRELKKIS